MATRLAAVARRAAAARAAASAFVHPTAHVHPSARLAPGVFVGPNAYVGPRCTLEPGVFVGDGVHIDSNTRVGPNASLEHCRVGAHGVLHAGVRIGADGFGFFVDGDDIMRKKPQLLAVLLGDHVELGAGSCVDRGSWRDTVIGDHTKLDNLVQVGHNVQIGRGSLLCAHAALGGSASLGDFCVMGGKSAVADHVDVCDRVRLAACSGVTKHITRPGDYAGLPARPIGEWRREVAHARRAARRSEGDGPREAPGELDRPDVPAWMR